MAKKNKFVLEESEIFQRAMNEKHKLEVIYGTDTAVKKIVISINRKLNELKLKDVAEGQKNTRLKKELEETKKYLQYVYLQNENITDENDVNEEEI